jgi:hypothetical protein
MIKFDENGEITKEYKNYISNLDRKELEILYIGADAYVDRLRKKINKTIDYINELDDETDNTIYEIDKKTKDELLNMLIENNKLHYSMSNQVDY